MKNHSFLSVFVLILFALGGTLLSCEKEAVQPESQPEETQIPLVYDSLYLSGKVLLHQTCTIVAVAEGNELSYSWELNLGTLLGSGSSVTFNACCAGNHNVKCTVTDGYGNSQCKEVNIFVPE
ncbi:MAG: PKD domain-containing protein [Bacteroidetes bacterium]|nr:PKD domain-containing protein [Bacteroidota bacterium]